MMLAASRMPLRQQCCENCPAWTFSHEHRFPFGNCAVHDGRLILAECWCSQWR